MKTKVQVGEDFDLSAELIDAIASAKEKSTRSRLAYCVYVGAACALVVSSFRGFYDGSFDELQSVWNAAGPVLGAVFHHYFGGSNGREKL